MSHQSLLSESFARHAPPDRGRALMQHNHDVALLDSRNRMVVLGFGKTAHEFALDPSTHQLKQQAHPHAEMLHDAAAMFQSADQLYYSERWFPDSR